jgi:hypothetical protein
MKYFWLLALVILVQFVSSCAPNQRIVNSSTGQWSNAQQGNGNQTPVRNSFERDLESMRTADFIFIYIMRRKDGEPLDADDKRFASLVIPGEMNRRSVSDEGKAIIIGSNFKMPEDSYKVLAERFAVEDLSRLDPAANANISQQPKQ